MNAQKLLETMYKGEAIESDVEITGRITTGAEHAGDCDCACGCAGGGNCEPIISE